MRFMIVVLKDGWCLVGAVEDDHEEAVVFSRAARLRSQSQDIEIGDLAHGPPPDADWELVDMRTRIPRGNISLTIEADGWECLDEPRSAKKARERLRIDAAMKDSDLPF